MKGSFVTISHVHTYGGVCRYIVHSDDHNPYMDSMEDFAKKLTDFHPDLLVVGGLQMMDNFPFKPGERRRLTGTFGDSLIVVENENNSGYI